MKKKKTKTVKTVHRHSFLLGVIGDILFVFTLGAKILGYPFKIAAHKIHKMIRHHPFFRSQNCRTAIAIALGICTLTISFIIEHWFNQPVWQCGIETMRAAGVCPVWETLAVVVRASSDV